MKLLIFSLLLQASLLFLLFEMEVNKIVYWLIALCCMYLLTNICLIKYIFGSLKRCIYNQGVERFIKFVLLMIPIIFLYFLGIHYVIMTDD